jgi:hypothetical protein
MSSRNVSDFIDEDPQSPTREINHLTVAQSGVRTAANIWQSVAGTTERQSVRRIEILDASIATNNTFEMAAPRESHEVHRTFQFKIGNASIVGESDESGEFSLGLDLPQVHP